MLNILQKVLAPIGPSGNETAISQTIRELITPYADEVYSDVMGNLIAIKKGPEDSKKIMLSAHMDQIGFIVTNIEKEGFLRVMNVGGINLQVAISRHVVFENGVHGILCSQPVPAGENRSFKHIYIDIGAQDKQEAESIIQIGDRAVYSSDFFQLGAHRVASPAMDDRCACALLIAFLQNIKNNKYTIQAVFSTQEEVGCRGAKTAAYALNPDIGIALDVTAWGDTPEIKEPAVKLGEGPAIKIMDAASISSPIVKKAMFQAAENAKITAQREILAFGGTDAGAIQGARGGVPVGTLSIPCRYVHSACETIDMRDMQGALKLLLAFIELDL